MAKTESDLLPCPFCGSPADPEGWSSIDRKGPACTNGKCDGAADSAEAWNARATDRDSFNAGWEKAKTLLTPGDLRAANSDDGVERIGVATHLVDWLGDAYTHCQYGSREWCEGYLNNARDIVRAYAAHPPAKALDGIAVTDEMVERALASIEGEPDLFITEGAMRWALEAALSVR